MGGRRTVFDAADDGARTVGEFECLREVWREVLYSNADAASPTSPWSISCFITDDTMAMGTAKPMPTLPPAGAMIAVLMPTSLPSVVTSAPPELPGLVEASVWMKSS